VNNVFVSTDSEEIASVSLDFGALVPRMRPPHLATNEAGKWEVWQDAVEMVEAHLGKELEAVLDLDCTSPLRRVDQIERAIDCFCASQGDLDALFSITPARKNPYFNIVEYSSDGYLELSKKMPEGAVLRRQDAPEVFEHAASIYVLDRDYLRWGTGLLSGKTKGFVMPTSDCIDIDSIQDFEWVEWLLKKRHQNGRFSI
jgi:N-acylneuraminate cytidylyltransferase